MDEDFSPLFQPLEIGRGAKKIKLKNRMVMPPMVTNLANGRGEVTQRMVDYYVERAKGGVGTIVIEAMDIQEPTIFFQRLGIFHDRFISELEYLASSIKENRAVAIAQIYQTGMRGSLPGPDDLSKKEIKELTEAFGKAAERVKRAGFDGVMIHGAHGYLINSFLSPLTNHRKDEYGGNREQRTRFAVEVIQSIRSAVGEDSPIFFRMNGEDFLPGGITVEDAVVTAPIAEAAGADVIAIGGGVGIVPHNLSLGNNKSFSQSVMPMYLPRGCRVELGFQIKKLLKVPMSIAGRINDPYLARDIIAQGKADLVDLGRQLMADPYFPQKVADGQVGDIRRCIACNYCLDKRLRFSKHVHCAVNPWSGREAELSKIKPALAPKKVLIIGGGIAGLETARWLGKRGHRVSLFEKREQLGGQTLLAALPPHKGEIHTLLDFLTRQMEKLGIEVHLNCEVTPEWVLREKPEVVIIATGGRPIRPAHISIDPKMKCLYAWDVLLGEEKKMGPKVVVLGGGFVAAEITDYLCEKRMVKDITIVEMREEIAFDLEPTFRELLMERLQEFGVKMVPNFLITEVTASEVIGQDVKKHQVKKIEADTVMLALGTEAVDFPVEAIKKAGIHAYIIGDANEPHGIAEAVRDGYLAGTSI